MFAQFPNGDVRCSSREKPGLKKRQVCYEKLSNLQNQLEEIVNKESLVNLPAYNMIPHQCFIYAVISNVENPLKDHCYRVRLDDETLSDVLCRIELDRRHPKVGPNMCLGDIIRIHRLTVQIEYDVEKGRRQMVLSTSPHHNYTIFKVYESGAIKYKTSANTIMPLNDNDKCRLREIAKWSREKFHQAVIESLRVRYVEIKETTTPVQKSCPPSVADANRLLLSSTRPAESALSERVENESSSAAVENEQIIPQYLCNESDTNTKVLQKSSKDSGMNCKETVSTEQNNCKRISEMRKTPAKLNTPEKVAAFLNSELSQMLQQSFTRSDQDHSFTKQSTKSSSSVECNPRSPKSSKSEQNQDVAVSAEEVMLSINQEMELMHSSQEQDFEGAKSTASSDATTMSCLNASFKSCLSQVNPVDENRELTIFDPDQTHVISPQNTSTSTDQNENSSINKLLTICLSPGEQGIDEFELENSSPQSSSKNARVVNTDREDEETESESLFLTAESAINSESVSVVTVLSENEQLELMPETLIEAGGDSVDEASEMYHSGPPPTAKKLNFIK